MASDDEHLGPLLRLWGLTTTQLPAPSETPDNLAPFLISILQEAVPFVDSVAPKANAALPPAPAAAPAAPQTEGSAAAGGADPSDPFPAASAISHAVPAAPSAWKPKGSKSYAESAAKVHLSERVVSSADLERIAGRTSPPSVTLRADGHLPAETWACRRSVHADSSDGAARSASWDEFRAALRDAHAESEQAFTPSVVGARAALVWDCGAVEAVEGGETWGRFTLRVEEIRHRLGRPFVKDRVFPVLQMTCSAMKGEKSSGGGDGGGGGSGDGDGDANDAAATARKEKPEFLVVSIAISNFGKTSEQAEFAQEKGVIEGAYTSVERVRKLPDSGDIEWIMATASDARGSLPGWMQTMAVPGQIAKDVPLFLSWAAKERKKAAGANPTSPTEVQKSDGAKKDEAPKEEGKGEGEKKEGKEGETKGGKGEGESAQAATKAEQTEGAEGGAPEALSEPPAAPPKDGPEAAPNSEPPKTDAPAATPAASGDQSQDKPADGEQKAQAETSAAEGSAPAKETAKEESG